MGLDTEANIMKLFWPKISQKGLHSYLGWNPQIWSLKPDKYVIFIQINMRIKKYVCKQKTQTDVTINDYKGLLFNSTLLPQPTICKSLMQS